MLTISKKQYEVFFNKEKDKFIEKSIVFLKENFLDWTKDKSESELVDFIEEIIDFGEQYNILSQLNLQKLMYYKIDLEFDIPLNEKLEESINIRNRHEEFLLRSFHRALTTSKTEL